MAEAEVAQTREGLHAVAEQVLASFRHRFTGRIGLEIVEGGFATPVVPTPDGPIRVAVVGTELVIDRGGSVSRQPLTTLAAAAAELGIEPGAPADAYPPATTWAADRPLDLDSSVAARLLAWFDVGERALRTFGASHLDLDPSPLWLWPEHFDLGFQMAEVNYGISLGDAALTVPYAYIGPWNMEGLVGDFWNQSFGAARIEAALPAVDDIVVFFETGRRLVLSRD